MVRNCLFLEGLSSRESPPNPGRDIIFGCLKQPLGKKEKPGLSSFTSSQAGPAVSQASSSQPSLLASSSYLAARIWDTLIDAWGLFPS